VDAETVLKVAWKGSSEEGPMSRVAGSWMQMALLSV